MQQQKFASTTYQPANQPTRSASVFSTFVNVVVSALSDQDSRPVKICFKKREIFFCQNQRKVWDLQEIVRVKSNQSINTSLSQLLFISYQIYLNPHGEVSRSKDRCYLVRSSGAGLGCTSRGHPQPNCLYPLHCWHGIVVELFHALQLRRWHHHRQ